MGKRKTRRLLLAEKKNELACLYEELSETKMLLARAYTVFNYSLDKELIEACIYEISSLQAKYSYLLREIKEVSETGPEVRNTAGIIDNVYFPKGDPV